MGSAGLGRKGRIRKLKAAHLDDVRNEINVTPLVEQVGEAMHAAGVTFELIVVDDGSTDRTLERLRALQPDWPWLRVLHRPEPRGQSAAMHAGRSRTRACE